MAAKWAIPRVELLTSITRADIWPQLSPATPRRPATRAAGPSRPRTPGPSRSCRRPLVEEVRLGLVQDDVRPHPRLHQLAATECQLERHPLHRRLRPRLVEHEVAERVPDRLALVDLDRAGPVGVVADDHVGPRVDARARQPLLPREGRGVVLGAPVREDDDEVGAVRARGADVLAAGPLAEGRAADPIRSGG